MIINQRIKTPPKRFRFTALFIGVMIVFEIAEGF